MDTSKFVVTDTTGNTAMLGAAPEVPPWTLRTGHDEDDETPAFDVEEEWGFPFDPDLNLEHMAPDQRLHALGQGHASPRPDWRALPVAGMKAATVVV